MLRPLFEYAQEEKKIQNEIAEEAGIDFKKQQMDQRRAVIKWEIEYAKLRHTTLIRRNHWGKLNNKKLGE
jgi:hypothetical protein